MNGALESIQTERLVGIIRLPAYHHAVEIAHALVRGGLRAIEYTMTGAGALEAVSAVRAALDGQLCVGAGTVLERTAAEEACAAGAQFLVTPAVVPDVIEVGLARGVPVVCGAFTPTEVLTAQRAGAPLIKLFPAHLGGPAYVRSLLGPFPGLLLVPTGGVGPENARAYLDAGAVAVAMGGNLVSAADVEEGRWEVIGERARASVAAVQRPGIPASSSVQSSVQS